MIDIDKAVVARLKTHGEVFEVLVDCDNALKLKAGKDMPMEEILAADKVFSDAKKGLLVSEAQMEAVFETSDPVEVAKKIIVKGEVQVTSEHRSKEAEQKLRKIIDIIHRNSVDPKTMAPHPVTRLELAFDEAKIRVDMHKPAEEQIEDILAKLRPILPIRFEKARVKVKIPAVHAGKAYSSVAGFGTIKKEEWLNDGSWLAVIELPAGLQTDLIEQVNKITHGDVETEIMEGEK